MPVRKVEVKLGEGGCAMTSPVTVSERDLRALLGIVGDHRSDLPPAGLPPSLLTDLRDQIRCDELQFLGQDTPRQTEWFAQYLAAGSDNAVGDPDDQELYWELYWDSICCAYPDRTGDVRSVTTVSDFYSARQWHSTAMYSEMFRPYGFEHELLLCLPAGHLRTVRLLLCRGPGSDFSERDRALLALLRPHLHQAYLDAEHRRRHPRLPRRDNTNPAGPRRNRCLIPRRAERPDQAGPHHNPQPANSRADRLIHG